MNLVVPRSLRGRVGLDLRVEVSAVVANPVKGTGAGALSCQSCSRSVPRVSGKVKTITAPAKKNTAFKPSAAPSP